MKAIMFVIDLAFWLWAFIVPAGIFGFLAFLVYNRSSRNLPYSILLLIIGVLLGIWVAETIRKKHGLVHFFSRLIATPELDSIDDKKDEN